jgi:hypothetical protein
MHGSKAARQVRGWMDFYAFDDAAFAALVAGVAGCSEGAVLDAVLGHERPVMAIARAIEAVTEVDAHDWYVKEPRRERPSLRSEAPAPLSETLARVA